MKDNIVYLLGDKNIDKTHILKSLGVNNNNNSNNDNEYNEYKINTKYYSANLNIKTIHLDSIDSITTTTTTTTKKEDNEKCSAVILVFDSLELNSFELIKSYIKNNKKIENNNDDDDDDDDKDNEEDNDNNSEEIEEEDILYILVDINKSNNNSIEDKIEKWCIENLIEWVIFDSKSHKEYDIRKSELTEIDEKVKYGVERVIEILESNMWPKMDLKSNNKNNNNNNLKKNDDIEEKEKQQPVDEDDEDEFSSIKDDKFLQDSLKKVEGFFKNIPSNNDQKKGEEGQDGGDVDDEKDDSIMMENTFKELQSIREHMKNLPDSQRRDMAAKIAMMFASSLNFDDDDDKDE